MINTIRQKISEIKKSANSNYIYRGEPEHHEKYPYYGKVSSGLWREYRRKIPEVTFDIEFLQAELLKAAKNYSHEPSEDDFEIMSQLQHYDGKTNLIDFTTDHLRSIFFACDGSPSAEGRVILLQRTEDINEKYQIKEPQNPRNRIIAQKSIFVQPPKGFIEPCDINDIVTIPANLKQCMLTYLREEKNISTETIYNDLHGFIKNQNIHQEAYAAFYTGLFHQSIKEFDFAIVDYTQAIDLHPNFYQAYRNRGKSYHERGDSGDVIADYAEAIKDYTQVIRLDSGDPRGTSDPAVSYNCGRTSLHRGDFICAAKDPFVHYDRGIAWLHLKRWEEAKLDLTYASDMGVNLIVSFRDDEGSIEDFEGRIGVSLPADIVEILTCNRRLPIIGSI